jgi:hypothetical protein
VLDKPLARQQAATIVSDENPSPASGVIGVFTDLPEAEEAIAQLGNVGVPAAAISLVTQNLSSEGKVHGFVTMGDVAVSGATTGSWVGGIFGLLGGAALVFTPAGPLVITGGLVAALLGGLEGSGIGMGLGGLTGAVFGHFVAKHHIPKIEQYLTGGKYLVAVQGNDETLDLAHRTLADHGAEITDHAGT